MRIQPSVTILLFIALTLSAYQPAAEQTKDDVAAIRALVEAWGAAAEAGDVARILACYNDDIVQMPPDAPANRGKQAIEEYYRGSLELFSVGVTWPVEGTEEIIVADGWAFHASEYISKFTPKAGGETIEAHGKIIEILKQQPDGSWKIAREIWNRNSPPDME
ncbi:MAG: SgcJ/EcaC family oxidoreductase [candidate division Zixibacteria bacterium]